MWFYFNVGLARTLLLFIQNPLPASSSIQIWKVVVIERNIVTPCSFMPNIEMAILRFIDAKNDTIVKGIATSKPFRLPVVWVPSSDPSFIFIAGCQPLSAIRTLPSLPKPSSHYNFSGESHNTPPILPQNPLTSTTPIFDNPY